MLNELYVCGCDKFVEAVKCSVIIMKSGEMCAWVWKIGSGQMAYMWYGIATDASNLSIGLPSSVPVAVPVVALHGVNYRDAVVSSVYPPQHHGYIDRE